MSTCHVFDDSRACGRCWISLGDTVQTAPARRPWPTRMCRRMRDARPLHNVAPCAEMTLPYMLPSLYCLCTYTLNYKTWLPSYVSRRAANSVMWIIISKYGSLPTCRPSGKRNGKIIFIKFYRIVVALRHLKRARALNTLSAHSAHAEIPNPGYDKRGCAVNALL